jgi:2-methylcitrate dehydratase PrpD
MPEPTLVERLAAFAAAARNGVPEDVALSVRQRILDIIGLQLAALSLDTSQAALGFVADQGGTSQAHVVGSPHRVPASWAAFANGVLAHSLDYDDTHLPSILHPSASVVPAALATAELGRASGGQVIQAVAVGLEVTVRVGMAGFDRESNNSTFFEHGQHATSICGTIGAATAAGMLLGLDSDGIGHAMGVAASMASGIIEANRTGGTVKRLHCGWAAHAGVTAALLAQRGITGPPTALEGRFGLFEAFLHGTYAADEVVDGLGSAWAVPGIFFKPYPANHFTHTGIDAALELRSHGLQPDEVRAATLRVASPTVRTIGEPLEVKQRPATGYQGQFSGPYTVAAALMGGGGLGVNLDDFADSLVRAPDRRTLMAKIRVVGDPECDAVYPYQFPAILELETVDGRQLEARVMHNRGGPENPLSNDELLMKFQDNAARALARDEVDRLAELVMNLEGLEEVTAIMRAAAAA